MVVSTVAKVVRPDQVDITAYMPNVGLGLEGQVVKFIDITNFFSYTYYTDHKNGYSRPESRNLD